MDVRVVTMDNLSKALGTLKFRPALALLLQARAYAADLGISPWEFAVEAEELCRYGLSINDTRYLAQLGYVDHARELPANGCRHRRFQPNGEGTPDRRTCFVLNERGLAVVNGTIKPRLEAVRKGQRVVEVSTNAPVGKQPNVPFWDAQPRVLSLRDKIVKRFRRRAVNQELILAAFHERGWPTRVGNPLAPQPARVMKRRLSDTVKCLNRGQVHRLIRFRCDGTGEAVIWESLL
jgi:hypothetical protein